MLRTKKYIFIITFLVILLMACISSTGIADDISSNTDTTVTDPGTTDDGTTDPGATDPVTPTDPVTDPVTPTDPVTDPVTPTDPVTDPVTPTDPVTDPVTPTDPVTDPVTPTDPVTDPVTPTEPVTDPVVTEPVVEPETTSDSSSQMSISMTANQDTYRPGEVIYCTVTIENTGDTALSDISFSSDLMQFEETDNLSLEPGAKTEIHARYWIGQEYIGSEQSVSVSVSGGGHTEAAETTVQVAGDPNWFIECGYGAWEE